MSVKAILAGQGSSGTQTFEAVYGTTTSAEIEAAYQKGQNVVCKYNGNVYQLTGRTSSTNHTFGVTTNSSGAVTDTSLICVANAWSTSSVSVASLITRSVTLTSSGWNVTSTPTVSITQTVSVQGVSATENSQVITIIPASSSQSDYLRFEISCTRQAENSLTFSAGRVIEVPSTDISLFVVIQPIV